MTLYFISRRVRSCKSTSSDRRNLQARRQKHVCPHSCWRRSRRNRGIFIFHCHVSSSTWFPAHDKTQRKLLHLPQLPPNRKYLGNNPFAIWWIYTIRCEGSGNLKSHDAWSEWKVRSSRWHTLCKSASVRDLSSTAFTTDIGYARYQILLDTRIIVCGIYTFYTGHTGKLPRCRDEEIYGAFEIFSRSKQFGQGLNNLEFYLKKIKVSVPFKIFRELRETRWCNKTTKNIESTNLILKNRTFLIVQN